MKLSKSQRAKALVVVLVVVVVIATTIGSALFVNHLIQAKNFKSQTVLYLKQATSDIPAPTGANLLYQSFFGSTICQYTGRQFFYAVDRSPEEIRTYYSNFLNTKDWGLQIEMVGRDRQSGETVEWLLATKSTAITTPQELIFRFMATPRNHVSVSFPSIPTKTLAEFTSSVSTIYSLEFIYRPNSEISAGCPAFEGQDIEWWEAQNP